MTINDILSCSMLMISDLMFQYATVCIKIQLETDDADSVLTVNRASLYFDNCAFYFHQHKLEQLYQLKNDACQYQKLQIEIMIAHRIFCQFDRGCAN